MVAAPQFSTFIFKGMSSRTYAKDAYLSDIANALARWDSGAGASGTSDTFWTAPEDLALVDYSQVTGMTDTTKIALTRDGAQTGDILRYAIHLTTLANRPNLRIGFRRGQKISAIQLA